jgi:integrase
VGPTGMLYFYYICCYYHNMASVNFYLKKPEKDKVKSLIYLQFKYNNIKLVFSFGQTIDPKNWNSNKQRVKSNNHTTNDGKSSLNSLLDVLQSICEKTYNDEIKNGIPQSVLIKQKLNSYMNQNKVDVNKPTFYKLIDRFTNNEIHFKGVEKKKVTLEKYKTVLKHLKDFELKARYPLDFDTINLDFFYKFLSFLKAKGLSKNTIAKIIQIIKTFMNEAVDLGYTSNMQFKNKKFTASWEETDAIYLTEKEILKLYKLDLSDNPKLEPVKDLFVFGCYVGLRFSDYSAIKPEHIISNEDGKFIRIRTKKTNEQVIIPCNPIVLKLFEKYKKNQNKLPTAPSNQKFNEYIKDVCKIAKLVETGRLISDPNKELWQCVSSHTARRSFATNLYLEGYPPIEIMKITGHKTEKAFLTYIKVSKLDAAKRLGKHMSLKWSEKLLKVTA